jgi:integrase
LWYIKYCSAGKVQIESSRTADYETAVRLLRTKVAAVDRGEPVTAANSRFTFEDAAKDLLNDYIVNNRRSRSMVERYIRKHLKPFFGGMRMTNITTSTINAYIAKRKADVIVVKKAKGENEAITKLTSNSQINRELTTIKRMFSLAVQSVRMSHRPFIAMLAEAPARAGFLAADQFEDIRRRLSESVQGIAEFAFLTGWRVVSEVVPLRWSQVDFACGTVRLESGMGKTGKARTFPLTRALRQVLKTQRTSTDEAQRRLGKLVPLVFHDEGRPIKRFDKTWKIAATAAGYPWTIPHDLRRCGVRNLVRAGVSEGVAMQMTGNKTRSVFERYNIVSEGDYRDAARRIDGFENGVSTAMRARKRA